MLYMDPVNKFLDRVRSGRVCVGAQHSIMSPQIVEMYGWTGLDFVVIGTEVEAIDKSMIETLMRAANAARIVPIIKLAHPDPKLVSETLNWGANIVLCPHVTSAKQLDELVAASRFYPIGTRGECPVARYTQYGITPLDDSRDQANRATSIIPIIEDKEALDNIEEIVANEHISLIEIGPFDFARSLETALRGPVIWAAIDKIVDAARAAGKHVMMPMWITPELETAKAVMQHQIDHLISRGITVLFQPDVHVLANHYRNLTPMREITVRDEPDEPVAAEVPTATAKANGKANGKAKPTAKATTKKVRAGSARAAKTTARRR
ncbi:MAG: HpcH/HpaI aldolase [Myxococcales bacterium]|nr:HpcH/HpaI aldolase [Myxococcales bacterium]